MRSLTLLKVFSAPFSHPITLKLHCTISLGLLILSLFLLYHSPTILSPVSPSSDVNISRRPCTSRHPVCSLSRCLLRRTWIEALPNAMSPMHCASVLPTSSAPFRPSAICFIHVMLPCRNFSHPPLLRKRHPSSVKWLSPALDLGGLRRTRSSLQRLTYRFARINKHTNAVQPQEHGSASPGHRLSRSLRLSQGLLHKCRRILWDQLCSLFVYLKAAAILPKFSVKSNPGRTVNFQTSAFPSPMPCHFLSLLGPSIFQNPGAAKS